MEEARKNFKGEIWAYATTLWEIFSHGAVPNVPNPVQFFLNGERPIKPPETSQCPVLYDIMIRGWDAEPDRRFAPQNIFSRLSGASELY